MSKKLIAAYTPVGTLPPFINISREDDGSVKVIVRGAAVFGTNPIADIIIPEAEWSSIADRIDEDQWS